jgi:hypothetical protein
MKRATYVLLACVFVMAGCVTDKLAVFEDNVLSNDEMKSFVGKYRVVAVTGEDGEQRPKEEFKDFTLEVIQKGNAYHFEYRAPEKSFGSFVLSRVPGQKAGALLFASPKVEGVGWAKAIENVFFIVKRDKDTIQLWLPVGNEAVAKDFPFTKKLSQGGGFKAAELREFLKKHADEYVSENAARMTFKKTL